MSPQIANPKKLALLNAGLVVGLCFLFSFLIRFSAVKETTWLDTIAIPVALAFGTVITLNVVIVVATCRNR